MNGVVAIGPHTSRQTTGPCIVVCVRLCYVDSERRFHSIKFARRCCFYFFGRVGFSFFKDGRVSSRRVPKCYPLNFFCFLYSLMHTVFMFYVSFFSWLRSRRSLLLVRCCIVAGRLCFWRPPSFVRRSVSRCSFAGTLRFVASCRGAGFFFFLLFGRYAPVKSRGRVTHLCAEPRTVYFKPRRLIRMAGRSIFVRVRDEGQAYDGVITGFHWHCSVTHGSAWPTATHKSRAGRGVGVSCLLSGFFAGVATCLMGIGPFWRAFLLSSTMS